MNLLCKIGIHKKTEASRAKWFMKTEVPMDVVAFKCERCAKPFKDGLLVPREK